MIEYKYRNYRVEPNGVTATYQIFKGAITTEPEWNTATEQEEPVTRFRRTQKLVEDTFTFTKLAAVQWLESIGMQAQADALFAANLETEYETYQPYFEIYMKTLLDAQAVLLGETAIDEQKIV